MPKLNSKKRKLRESAEGCSTLTQCGFSAIRSKSYGGIDDDASDDDAGAASTTSPDDDDSATSTNEAIKNHHESIIESDSSSEGDDDTEAQYSQREYTLPGGSLQEYMTQQHEEIMTQIQEESPEEERPENTKEVVYLVTNLRGTVAFRRGETWTGPLLDSRKYYVIESFPTFGGLFCTVAQCKVFMRLKDTFVAGDCPNNEFVRCANIELIPLKFFADKYHNVCLDEDNILVYETSDKTTHGVGWYVTYKLEDNNQYEEEVTVDVPTLEIFAGGGGMSEGLKNAGMEVKWAVEMDAHAASTWDRNHQGQIFEEDFRDFKKQLKRNEGRCSSYGQVRPKHVHGSPSCCPFSKANRTGGRYDEDNKKLTTEYFEFVADEDLDIETFSMENVDNLIMDSRHRRYAQQGLLSMIKAGWQVSAQIVSSENFGDPQNRKRAIFLGAKRHLPFFPALEKTHGREADGLEPIVTVRAAIGDLEHIELVPKEKHASIVHLANGKEVYGYHSTAGTALRSETIPLMSQCVAATVTRSNAMQHYSKERCLTVREEIRLMGLRDTYRISGSATAQRGIIGNFIPFGLGTAGGRAIMKSYRKKMPNIEHVVEDDRNKAVSLVNNTETAETSSFNEGDRLGDVASDSNRDELPGRSVVELEFTFDDRAFEADLATNVQPPEEPKAWPTATSSQLPTNPYAKKANPYAKKENPYAKKANPYAKKSRNPYAK